MLSREDGVEEIIMGMVSESAEKEDLNIVEDIQSMYISWWLDMGKALIQWEKNSPFVPLKPHTLHLPIQYLSRSAIIISANTNICI